MRSTLNGADKKVARHSQPAMQIKARRSEQLATRDWANKSWQPWLNKYSDPAKMNKE
jgi:hypothetical protein